MAEAEGRASFPDSNESVGGGGRGGRGEGDRLSLNLTNTSLTSSLSNPAIGPLDRLINARNQRHVLGRGSDGACEIHLSTEPSGDWTDRGITAQFQCS